MLSNANLLLLDEPTNHLDMDSKQALEEAIRDYDGTVISISHDRYFLNATCNKIFKLEHDKLTEYLGNYDYYLEKTKVEDEEDEEYISKTQRQNQNKINRQIIRQNQERKRQKEALENKIQELEINLSTIDQKLLESSSIGDFKATKELSLEREDVEIKLNSAYEEWMLLEDI